MRFSIVCYLDEQATSIVRGVQQELGELTGARASLDLWLPHITVGDGIEVPEQDIAALCDTFKAIALHVKPFEVHLRDILKVDFRKGGEAEVTTPYGLYLDVEVTKQLLELVGIVGNTTQMHHKWYYMPNPYHPHSALAFKDLSKEGYEAGIAYLDEKDLSVTSRLSHVSLVEMLPGQTREYARFHFG